MSQTEQPRVRTLVACPNCHILVEPIDLIPITKGGGAIVETVCRRCWKP